ncbi:exonuclease domain-containing protein [Pseudomarimonas arenosa]|uniref:3'-5' exonuclease n=1 Tax=Pseudomarimonas arenosa TaxID=2774145 RepID=A0AAW3ZRJ7_9GAMM|nr:3'-5' exonuclease [Pseudomarimonas arenosa]
MIWPGQRWWESRSHRHGPYAACFQPYRGPEWVAFDLETTGLDPGRDHILSMAMVPGAGALLRLRERLTLTVQSDSKHIGAAIEHHGIRPADLAQGLPIRQALDEMLRFVGNRPLVGYCPGFDRAMLDRPLRACFGFGLPNRLIDVRHAYQRWRTQHAPGQPAVANLDAIATALGIPLFERHDALGDAVTAGLIHIRLRR